MMKQSFKDTYFTKINILGFLLALVAAYLLFPPYFDMSLNPIQYNNEIWITLDPSWVTTLNYVKIKGMQWGTDFAFTLGPLSYLTTRVGWGQNSISFLIFDLFCALNIFLVFFISFVRSRNKFFTAFLIILLVVLLPTPFWSTYAFVLMSFLLFWIRYSLDKNLTLIYIFQAILVVLLFFIKFNTGLISFVFFAAAILYKIIFKKDKLVYLLGYFILPIIGIYILSGILNVNLPEYIKSALEIVSGYNEVMYSLREFCDKHLFALIIILISAGVLVYKTIKDDRKDIYKNGIIFFLFSVSMYVLFKQSFVRADESHMKEFYYCAMLIVFCIYDFHLEQKNKYFIGLISIAGFISIYFIKKLDVYALDFKVKMSKEAYFNGYTSFTPTSGYHLYPNNNQMPPRILNRIGNSSIDSYPWNTQILLENRLNFTPRPVFQSYTAYTEALEDKNVAFYNSSKAPQFVLYDFCAIDDRYPLFDEPKLNLILSKNYSCVDTLSVGGRPSLLLEKKANSNKVKLVKINEYAIYMDSPLIPKEGIYYKVVMYRNLLGDFMSVIDHGPDISLSVVDKVGNTRKYRTSNKLLETGIFSTQHITNVNDFKSLGMGEIKEESQIRAYCFEPKSKLYFKDKIRIIEYKITE
ncbi:hypothetical protein [Flavobacterium wongokense]|uniref:hypothetical protein n=1 Tax=Flavobacterium wongokense TaxID=2910674 RepID=UPI001F234A60|nr:hypothetical protein [Flavobacterium sp. WG47]MCF6131462.1 hypothetical protein [Flavobacterium sp. WG47]